MKGGFIRYFKNLIDYLDRLIIRQNQLKFNTVLFLTVLIGIYSIMASQKVQVSNLTKGISNFALDFYQECAQSKPGNVIISPLSVASALALLSQGTNGNTYEELKKGLHFTDDKAAVANQFSEYYALLQQSVGNSTLSIANKIFVQKGYDINKNFEEVAVKKYSSSIAALDFVQSEASAKAINQFVEEQTKNKIKDLIRPDMLDSLTRLVLVNAIYFKGNWEHKFKKERTTEGDFYVSESESVPVNFMHTTKKFNYAVLDDLDATALEMKYANSNFSFVIVLPNSRTGLSALESKLKIYDLAQITDKMYKQEVEVTIPKFKVEFEINLNDALKKLGMVEMFGNNADLSGLLDSSEPLQVSQVVHKAFIEVNEEGSEAAAATGMVAVTFSMPMNEYFVADHGFLYHILDKQSKTTVFTGRLTTIN